MDCDAYFTPFCRAAICCNRIVEGQYNILSSVIFITLACKGWKNSGLEFGRTTQSSYTCWRRLTSPLLPSILQHPLMISAS